MSHTDDHREKIIREHLERKKQFPINSMGDLIAQLKRAKERLNHKESAAFFTEDEMRLRAKQYREKHKMKHLVKACLYHLKNPEIASYEINLENYKKDPTIVSVYATKKAGGQEAYVIRKFGNDKYRYIGKLGAGTGDLKQIANEIKSTLASKKQVTLIYGKDITKLNSETSTIEDDPQLKSLRATDDNLLNQIQQLNKKLDNKQLTGDQKEVIHDQLDRLKDRRKQNNIKISNLKIRLGKKK